MKSFFRRLGFGLGEIEIHISRPHFFLGECLEGEVRYELREPTAGKVLAIQIDAAYELRRPETSTVYEEGRSRKETKEVTKKVTLFSDKLTLQGESTFSRGAVPFQLQLPYKLPDTEPSELGRIVEFATIFKHGIATTRGPLVWDLETRLDIPWSASLKKSVVIQVSEPPHPPHNTGTPPGFLRATRQAQPPAPPARKVPKFCSQCGNARTPEHRHCMGCGRRFEQG